MEDGRRKRLRAHPRYLTHWEAECRIGVQVYVGVVRDLSSHGAFFAPQAAGAADRAPTPKQTPPRRADSFADADEAVVLTLSHRLTDDVSVAARVRWSGYSKAHDCLGFGIAFAAPPPMLTHDRSSFV